jgi:hypothetical protein
MRFNNTHQLDTLHIHFHLIKTQSLDMFRASLAHPQNGQVVRVIKLYRGARSTKHSFNYAITL